MPNTSPIPSEEEQSLSDEVFLDLNDQVADGQNPAEQTEQPIEPGQPKKKPHGRFFRGDMGSLMVCKKGNDPNSCTDFAIINNYVEVVHVREREDGRHIYRIRSELRDGSVREADLEPKLLESIVDLNTWSMEWHMGSWELENLNRKLLKEYITKHKHTRNPIIELNQVGYIHKYGIRIGKSGCIDSEGNWSPRVDSEPLMFTCSDGQKRCFHINVRRFGQDMPNYGISDPGWYKPKTAEDQQAARKEARAAIVAFLDACKENLGTSAMDLCLGYLMAHEVSDYFINEWQIFPHLYIYGRTQTGKSTIARLAMKVAGSCLFEGQSFSGSTAAALRNSMAIQSSQPYWVSEVRMNDYAQERFMERLRTSYDRSPNQMSNKNREQIDVPQRRSMLLVGEEFIGQDAEHSRCIMYEMEPPKNKNAYTRVLGTIEQARNAWTVLLTDPTIGKQIVDAAKRYRNEIVELSDADDRRAMAWATAMAGYEFLTDETNYDFIGWIHGKVEAAKTEAEQVSVKYTFFQAAEVLFARADLGNEGTMKWAWFMPKKRRYVLWLNPVMMALEQARVHLSMRLVTNEIKAINGYAGYKSVRIPRNAVGAGDVRQCHMFYEHTMLPDWIKRIAKGELTELEEAAVNREMNVVSDTVEPEPTQDKRSGS